MFLTSCSQCFCSLLHSVIMNSVSQPAASSPQGLATTETLLFFPQYPSSHAISKRVLYILVAFQTVDFCCTLTVVILLAIMIDLLTGSALQVDVAPDITNIQSILIIAMISLALLPVRISIWKRSMRSQPAAMFRLFITTILGLSIVLWGLIIFVLLVEGAHWGGRLEKERLYKTQVMRVCLPCSLHSQHAFAHLQQKGSLACACVIVYLEVIGLVVCWAYTTSLFTEEYRRVFQAL